MQLEIKCLTVAPIGGGQHRHRFKATNHAGETFDGKAVITLTGDGIAARRVPLLLLPGDSAEFRIDALFAATGFVVKGTDCDGSTAIEGVQAA